MKTITQEYRPSKRVEDQEAGPFKFGRAEMWPVRPDVTVWHIVYDIDESQFKAFDIEKKL